MLDTYGLANMIYDVVNKKEKYEPAIPNTASQKTWNIISIILSILIGLFAFYLSWSCNTALGYHIIVKVIFGVFAFLFGLVYLILYIIFRIDTCAKIMKKI